jgi:hypothetical protein
LNLQNNWGYKIFGSRMSLLVVMALLNEQDADSKVRVKFEMSI